MARPQWMNSLGKVDLTLPIVLLAGITIGFIGGKFLK